MTRSRLPQLHVPRLRVPQFRRSGLRVRHVGVVAVVALAGVLVWQVIQLRENRIDDSRREEVREVATAQVLDLTTLDSETVDQKLESMTSRTAGEFTDQIGTITATFADLVRTNQISASGAVDAAAVSRLTEDDATVIVASTATVKEAGGEPTQRTYRLRVTMEHREDDWKITGMEFVQ